MAERASSSNSIDSIGSDTIVAYTGPRDSQSKGTKATTLGNIDKAAKRSGRGPSTKTTTIPATMPNTTTTIDTGDATDPPTKQLRRSKRLAERVVKHKEEHEEAEINSAGNPEEQMRGALRAVLGEDEPTILHKFCKQLLVKGLVPQEKEDELYALCGEHMTKLRTKYDARFNLAEVGVLPAKRGD